MPTPSCPRCGYDLSGPVATWDDTGVCPLEGTCSECGLGFRWFDVMTRDIWRLDGFVEHARDLRTFVRWAIRTTCWAIWPWRFWNRVEMHHRVRPWAWFAWFPAVTWTARTMALLAFLLELLLLLAIRPGSQLGIPSIGQLLWPVVGLGYDYWGPGYFGDWGNSNAWRLLVRPTTLVAGAAILWPLCMAALPISLRAARVRPILVARAAAFSLTIFSLRAWVGLVWLIICGFIRVLAGKSIYSSSILGIPESPIASFFRFLERCWYYMSYSPWPVLIWLALWWLAALTRGFKLKQGVLAWLAIVVLVHVAMAVMFGVEFRAFGHYYRL